MFIISSSTATLLLQTLANQFSQGTLELYQGPMPSETTVDTLPANNTLIMSIPLPLVPFTVSAATQTLSIAGQWWGTAVVSGTPNWFRLVSPAGQIMVGTVTPKGGAGPLTTTTDGSIAQYTNHTIDNFSITIQLET